MIVDTLISSVSKYFTSLSVDSIWGYKKVSLMTADDNMVPTGYMLTIDATSNANVTISKSVMQHSSESKKVYMDGTKINPVKMSIAGHIETAKLLELQELASNDIWMYVSMTKDMGGSYLSMSPSSQKQTGRITEQLGLTDNSATQLYADSKLYTITNLTINDDGFINTVSIVIDLMEVVIFDYGIQYKFGVKQNKGKGKTQSTSLGKEEIKEPPLKTIVGGTK
ncbi:MAG: hypothetical protein ACRCX2_12680 [Paraclostridium sp.]